MRYKISDHAIFELDQMPGCKQIAIISHAFVPPEFRNQGFGKRAEAERIEMLRLFGYNYALATVRDGNVPQEHIMKEWTVLDSFANTETGNLVKLYGRKL